MRTHDSLARVLVRRLGLGQCPVRARHQDKPLRPANEGTIHSAKRPDLEVRPESMHHGSATSHHGIAGLTFHDLRGSAVVRLALAEATVPQIATFTGHSLRDVEQC